MREKKEQLVVTFHTTSEAMSLEKYCALDGIPGRLFPVPRALTADCGMAFRTEPEYAERLNALIADRGLDISGTCLMML